MIIHCLACGKSVSSNSHRCPYCMIDINQLALEANGIENTENLKDRVKGLMFGMVHK